MRLHHCLLFGALAACAVPPVNYASPGTSWTLPLVSPLDGGELIVPATIDGHGTYLLALDPDADESVLDQGVAERLDLYLRPGYERVDDQDWHAQPRRHYEINSLHTGDLELERIVVRSAPAGSLVYHGRRVDGILGGFLVNSAILVDVDRDRGVVRLVLTGHLARPENAVALEGSMRFGRLIVPMQLGERTLEVMAAAGRGDSSLWPQLFAGLAATRERRVLFVDETGSHNLVAGGAVAPAIALAGLEARDVRFASFADARVRRDEFDGVLGEDVLSHWHVVIDRDAAKLWLAPRNPDLGATTAARIARWPALSACAAAGCAQIAGSVLRRDPAAAGPFDVTLQGGDGRLIQVLVTHEIETLPEGSWRVVDAAPAVTRAE